MKLTHFPGRFVGCRPASPTDSEAWPMVLHSYPSLSREPTAATSAHIPHCYLFLWDRRSFQLGFQCNEVLSEVVLCISPSNITQIARSCSPVWLTSGENCQNPAENQHSVLHVHRVALRAQSTAVQLHLSRCLTCHDCKSAFTKAS